MVTITNGIDVFTVTNGAFESIYKKQGYTVYDPSEKVKAEPEKAEQTDDEFVEKLEEKPLSHWNKNEIKRYASIFGLDISKTKNISEARDIIREFKEESEEA